MAANLGHQNKYLVKNIFLDANIIITPELQRSHLTSLQIGLSSGKSSITT
jgi:hypothetical protein